MPVTIDFHAKLIFPQFCCTSSPVIPKFVSITFLPYVDEMDLEIITSLGRGISPF